MFKYANRIMKTLSSSVNPFPDHIPDHDRLVDLSIGQVHFPVPEDAKTAACKAIMDNLNGYTPPGGIHDLNKDVLRYVKNRYDVEGETSIITSGATGGLLLSFLSLINRNDEILLPEPYFVSYFHLAGLCEAKITYYSLYPDFRLDIEDLEKKITKKTKAIVVNSPGNPTGAVFNEEEIKKICAMCEKNDVTIISDEIYADFIYDVPHISPLKYYPETILISGLSKTFGMAGWRLGYVIGPNSLLGPMKALQMFTHVCPPSPLQYGGVEALGTDMSQQIASYRRKRDLLYNGIREKYQCVKPDGAFYIFPKVPEGFDDMEFTEHALEHDLKVFPGRFFSRKADHFRVSFAADDDTLQKGIEILNRLF